MHEDHLDTIVGRIRPGDVICTSGAGSFPARFFAALGARTDLHDVTIGHPMRQHEIPYAVDYAGGRAADLHHISDFTWDAPIRDAIRAGRASYRPENPHRQPASWQRAYPTDVFVTSVSPPDRHGYVSLGAFGGLARSFLDATAPPTVIFEINRHQPRVLGQVSVPLSAATASYEAHYELPQIVLGTETSDADRAIAEHVADLIPDGATIQIGVGAIPDTVARLLVAAGKRHLGIHSENISDSLVELVEAGVVDNSRKQEFRGVTVCTLAVATDRTYRFLDDNPGVHMLPMTYVNDPFVIAANPAPVSVNAAVTVDLMGQCASESIGPAHYSGTGGQWEFVHGAGRADDGRAIVTLASTARNGTLSTIVAQLPQGTPVTIPRNEGPTVVTEYGVADLRGKSVRDRARSLLAITHPDFTDKLRHEAVEAGLL
ncbi:acetyl-CoA hydrolase/transferase C-terminal domain-containing protein [Pseudonocardia ailaonensis]|uniref:Acetyl-CoA hydrolase/transferase C-terminal domain-containing protein n=1 Tax=Pseudonocardia ailaonensis TaxID=367279 RepID=A0ABN2NC33_9PSEU